jgi:beta-galactosidase
VGLGRNATEPRAAILLNWDTDAILLQEPERHDLRDGPSPDFRGTKMQAVRARVGLARALINTRTPFAYLAESDLAAGLGPRYPALYAPHMRAVSRETIEALGRYARAGGRLIADVQFGFLDPWGKLHPAGEGGPVERVFGAWVDTQHDARTAGMALGTILIRGFWGDLVPTSARVIARFADGRPAITERQVGRGTAVLVAFDAARMCFEPGCEAVERLIASLVWGDARPSWESDAPMAFRLAAPKADHYFLLNDGPARPAFLKAYDHTYARGREVLDGGAVDVRGTIAVALPAESALWLRFEKA